MLKKALALVLATVLCLGILAACDNNSSIGTGDTTGTGVIKDNGMLWFDEPLKLEISRATQGSQQEEQYLINLLKENCNIELTLKDIDSFGSVYTQMLGDQKVPDVTYLNVNNYGNEYGPRGAYVNVGELLDQMPNLKATLEKYPQYKEMWTNADGSMYHIPVFSINGDIDPYVWFYREDIFAKHNLTWPSDRAGLEALLRQLKTLYPNSSPLGLRSLNDTMSLLCDMGNQFGAKGLYPGRYGTFASLNNQTGEYYESASADEMKDMIAWIKQMRDEGLINIDAPTIARANWIAMFATEKAFIGFDKLDQVSSIDLEGKRETGSFSLVGAAPIAMNASATKAYLAESPSIYSFVVAKKAQRAGDILQFIDWMYSDTGMMLTNWGKEGVDYTMVNGKPQWTAEALADGNPQNSRGLAYAGLHTLRDCNAYTAYQSENMIRSYEIVNPWLTQENYYPIITNMFNDAEWEFMTQYGYGYQRYVLGELAKFLTGNRSLNDWDAFRNEASTRYKGAEIAQKTTEAYQRVYGSK